MAVEGRMDRLEDALSRLAEAQVRTEERMGYLEAALAALAAEQRQLAAGQQQLVAAQARTDERTGRLEAALAALAAEQRQLAAGQQQLVAAQARTDERTGRLEAALAALTEGQRQLTEGQRQLTEEQRRLSQAQARTEAALRQLARQVGGLSDAIGGDTEDIAYIVLHSVLQREFGWDVGVLQRTWQRWNGRIEEINVFGRATDPARPGQTIWIVGEAKHNLTLREVEKFARQATRARQHLIGEVYAVCFSYRARPEVQERLQALRIPLLFSYGRFAGEVSW
jgi:hypothetical protein